PPHPPTSPLFPYTTLFRSVNAPLALEQATYRATGLGDLTAQAERWVLSRADAVLAVSAPLRDYVVSLGVEPSRVHVIPNGVDPTDRKSTRLNSSHVAISYA